MLDHQDQNSEQEQPAAQVRVNSEELARALAAIEARRQEEAQRLEGTVVLGDVVQVLQLDITPEELLAEVQAQRERSASAQTTPTREWTTEEEVQRDFWRGMRIGGSILAATIFLIWLASSNSSPHFIAPPRIQPQPFIQPQYHGRWQDRLGPLDAAFRQKLTQCLGPAPDYQIVILSTADITSESSGEPLYPLNAVPDGYPLHGQPNPQWIVMPPLFAFRPIAVNPTLRPLGWTLTRYDGRFYQRGWIYQEDKGRVLQGHLTGFYPNANPPYMPPHDYIPLTLALGSYQGQTRYPTVGQEYLLLQEGQKATLDSHAWEQDLHPSPFRNQTPPFPASDLRFPILPSYYYSAGFDASSVLKPFADVPDGRIIHCSQHTLNMLLHTSQSGREQVLVDTRGNLNRPWMITKLHGRTYLRGWVAARASPQLAAGQSVWIYSESHANKLGASPVQITVRLDGVKYQSSFSSGLAGQGSLGQMLNMPTQGIELSNVTLDEHAWEKWESQ